MAAMVAKKPDSVRWAPSLKATQNAAPVKPGDGVWQTASRLDDYRVLAVEPEAGQGVVLSSIDENGIAELQMTRLRVDPGGRISESESLFARNGEGQRVHAPPAEDVRPDYQEALPATDRLRREELVEIVDKYFDAIEKSDGTLVAFAPDGYRIENGVRTCNDPHRALGSGMEPLFGPVARMTCAQGLSSGIFSYIKSITPRRYPVVDREHGLVLALVRFNHPGNILTPEVRGAKGEVVGKADMMRNEWASHPTSALIAELFKVKNGRITRVFAVIVRAPYRAPTGWDE
ncbi:MAG: hypothetical protein M3O31_17460 [Acidobacteriota bacterium]|nr:hypothetical protein [Acidobacteriota bacterium]